MNRAPAYPLPPTDEAHLYDPAVPPILRFAGPYRFLSNYFRAPTWIDLIEYPTNEHWFNSQKTLVPSERAWILADPDPAVAKRRGNDRTGKVTLRPDWDTVARFEAMDRGLHAKFTAHPGRAEALLATGRALLVESTTWHDQVWGSCVCGRPACAEPGLNHLGRALMRLRHQLTHPA